MAVIVVIVVAIVVAAATDGDGAVEDEAEPQVTSDPLRSHALAHPMGAVPIPQWNPDRTS
jgi:hypothetical protein